MPRPHPARLLLAALALALVPGEGARAQWRAELELSGARLRQDEHSTTSAVTFGSLLAFAAPRLALDLTALGTFGDGAQRTTQALGSAAWLGAFGARALWSLGVSGSAFAEQGSKASVSGYVTARQQLLFASGGAWAGASIGGVSDRGDPFPVRSLETGLWRGARGVQGLLSATLVDTRASEYKLVGSEFLLVAEPATYTDAGASLRWEPTRTDGTRLLHATVRGGARFIARGAGDGPRTKGFGGVDLEVPLVAGFAVAGSYGRQLSDLARGTPASRYTTLGVRLDVRGLGRATPPRVTRPSAPASGPRLSLVSGTLAVDVADARQVELSASFTGWEPVALERRDGRWTYAATALPQGTHRVLVRVDGGAWLPPVNLPVVDDGDGARVGLLVVP
ncbi:MAG TPA: glycogen-binding domain-containing protein [Gemmatimonadaceae bacterium]|nr:glycogen-binding domain-containing protein [Gemmatimonadaceae bacterium]